MVCLLPSSHRVCSQVSAWLGWWLRATPCCQAQVQLGVKWEVTELGCEAALYQEAGARGTPRRATRVHRYCARVLNFTVFNTVSSA